MTAVALSRWELDAEMEATRECYRQIPKVDVDDCICDGCRNFRALVEKDFSPAVLAILQQLGISLRKPSEVTHYGRDGSQLHIYHLWYHAIGSVKNGRDGWKQNAPNSWSADFETLEPQVAVGVTTKLSPLAPPFRDRGVFQLEFDLRLPWVLAEPYVETAT